MTDLRQTKEYSLYLTKLGWIVEKIDNTYIFIKKIPILGSVIKVQRPEKLINYKVIELLSKKYKPFKIIVEPETNQQINELTSSGFKLSKTPYLPTKTIYINLSRSLKKLLSKMHYKTRYNIKVAQKKGVEIILSDQIETFAKFWNKESLKQGRFIQQHKEIVSLYKAFDKNVYLLLAFKENLLLGGILMPIAEKIAYYMYAVSSGQGKKLFAPTLLAWKAIMLAKKKGAKFFDFEGIYDERFPLKAWKGFTRFKKSFGGHEIQYPGAFTKFLLPF